MRGTPHSMPIARKTLGFAPKGLFLVLGGILVFVLALIACLCLGSVSLRPAEVLAALGRGLGGSRLDPTVLTIVWELRLPRSLLALVAGAALGAAGAVFQGLFRNPLADPYILGVSSGASLGAVLAIAFGLSSPLAFIGATEFLAFAGAIAASVLVYAIAGSSRGSAPPTALLLAGTAIGSFLSALVSLIVTLNNRDLHQVYFWILGGFGGRGWHELGVALPPALVSVILAFFLARPLDLLGAGEEAAGGLGLNLGRTRRLAVVASSLGAAAAVASGGVIGFVGLLGPHFARLVVGPGHRRLIPSSAVAGGLLLMAADAVARSVAAPLELPVGVVTALLGAPLFLRLLAKRGLGGRS